MIPECRANVTSGLNGQWWSAPATLPPLLDEQPRNKHAKGIFEEQRTIRASAPDCGAGRTVLGDRRRRNASRLRQKGGKRQPWRASPAERSTSSRSEEGGIIPAVPTVIILWAFFSLHLRTIYIHIVQSTEPTAGPLFGAVTVRLPVLSFVRGVVSLAAQWICSYCTGFYF